MSQLDQAKKEAKRLFNLAKANQEGNQSPEIQISIPKLSSAREIVAVMNGYKNWHDYQEVLKRKDFIFDKVDKNTENKEIKVTLERKKYFIQDLAFHNIENPNQFKKKHQVIIKQPHIPITLGHHKEKTFFDQKEKHWILNQYPVLLTGSTGAGKTETLLSLGSQYIKNNEGLIYIDATGATALYTKIFSYAQQNNRIDDLYLLNFMIGSRDLSDYTKDGVRETLSHSIDPINPMVGNDQYFNDFFGKEIGGLIHAILKHTHEKNHIMDIESLESILMLNNLMQWQKDNAYNDLPELSQYLTSIGLSLVEENDENDLEYALEKHALHCIKAYDIVHLIKNYPHIFKMDCSIDMMQIFLQRKILLVLLPTLEKTHKSLSMLGEFITAQIAYTEQKIDANIHLQNIILDQFIYYSHNIHHLKLSTTKNNYIFANYDFEYLDQENFNYVFTHSKTYVGMKYASNDIHTKLKLDIINNVSEFPKEVFGNNVFSNNNKLINNLLFNLKNQREGQAIVFCMNNAINTEDVLLINSENTYYIQRLRCVYLPCPWPKKLWLVEHPRLIINKL